MNEFELITDRDGIIKCAAELVSKSEIEVLGMGRQIAWVDTEKTFSDACNIARSKKVSMKMLAIKDEGQVKDFAKSFEKIGAFVRYYDHGDIRVVISDRKEALLAIPSITTVVTPGPREYAGLRITNKILIDKLVERFDDMWTVGWKSGEAVIKDKIRYFFLDHKGEIYVGVVVYLFGSLLEHL